MIGDGYAIDLTEGNIFSPVSGKITMSFPTGHAIGITTQDGREILIHLGLDTVNLKGRGFNTNVKEGDKIKRGALLSTIDLKYIKSMGYSTISLMIFITGERINLLKPHSHVTHKTKGIFDFIKE